MKYVHCKTAIGSLSLLLILSACSSGSKPRVATSPPSDLPRSDVVTDRGTTPYARASNVAHANDPRSAGEGLAAACPSRVDATGKAVYDDPACPDRYRSQKDQEALASACPSRTDANGKVIYEDPACPDRYRSKNKMTAVCASRTDANGKIVYDDQSCPPPKNLYYVTKENAYYDRYADKAAKHARAAEIASSEGNLPDMLHNAEVSLDHAKEARRAGVNANLANGIAALRESIRLGEANDLTGASASIREARVSLSRAAGIKTWEEPRVAGAVTPVRAQTLKGELSRNTAATSGSGQEYLVRDAQNHEVPIALSPEMSQQVQVGDMVEAQIDQNGQVTSITKAQ